MADHPMQKMSSTSDPDPQRIEQIRSGLAEAQLDALACALPPNVLMLSGYWPVVGSSVCVADAGGRVVLIVPEDEEDLARQSRADEVRTFKAGSLENVQPVSEALREPLEQAVKSLDSRRIGVERGETSEPASYAGHHAFGQTLSDLLSRQTTCITADALLERLREIKTQPEISRIRAACRLAGEAFGATAARIHADISEIEAADVLHGLFRAATPELLEQGRVEVFAYCMSGPNAAEAYGAFQRCRTRKLKPGDLVLMHCNGCIHGYWIDITRTYFLGSPTAHARRMYDAVFAARSAAIASIRDGIAASEVDRAARTVMEQRGFGKEFKTPLGHGVGFAAIDHNALPRLHPKSPDKLEIGCMFNIEPGIYVKNQCGMRHCDMIAMTPHGPELLTDFQSSIDLLVL